MNHNVGDIYLVTPSEASYEVKAQFLSLLIKQDRVLNPTILRIERCKVIGYYIVNGSIVSIGAIKPKTNSDFDHDKSNLSFLRNDFEWEIGYCYTEPRFRGNKYSSIIVEKLITSVHDTNLMASTELRSDNIMLRILQKNGFKQYGASWKSIIHGGAIGLFLKYNKES